jgi:hypothetical protein
LEIYTLVPFIYLESPPLFLCPTHHRRLVGHVLRTRRPRARSELCHVPSYALPAAFPTSRWPALASPRRAAAARAATPPAGLPAPAPAQPRLLLDPEHILELPTHSLLHLHTPILLPFLCSDHHTPPEHRHCHGSPSTATHAASHPRSSAQIASPSPTQAHQPAQSRSHAPE